MSLTSKVSFTVEKTVEQKTTMVLEPAEGFTADDVLAMLNTKPWSLLGHQIHCNYEVIAKVIDYQREDKNKEWLVKRY
jgi:hypothetical protein